uniref:A4_EXTRA domain-containing protein n=1 Tax=Meloidogyne incognita TaxID=6306 RepID=A0A914MZJ6_MELIC
MTAALLFLLLISLFGLNFANHITSEIFKTSKKHEHFMPLVAFNCGYRNKFMNKDGRWQDDPSSVAGCLHGKYDILKYCKRVYPNEEINNIVEYPHITKIDRWCREAGKECYHQFNVRPFRCIGGEFVTESLQVPHRCHFDHIIGRDKCNDFNFWNTTSEGECLKKKETTKTNSQQMQLFSFALLEPCGLGMFRGVEFVCCPKDLEEKIEKIVVDLETPSNEEKKKTLSSSDDEEEEEDDDEEEEEYTDEDEDEDLESDDKLSKSKKKGKASTEQQQKQDPYFKEDNTANEHERFIEAEERLEKKHRKKVTKVITGWSELFERYNKMKEKDPKGAEQYKREMTGKFRKTIASLETENREQRKQLEDLHNERVQTSLNEKKRQATHEYRAALAIQVGRDNKENVLRTLKNYIRAEEKDRLHMLNRYRHLLRSGQQEEAISFEPILLHRLRYIDLRINGTLAMLRDFPELEKELRPKSLAFWKAYRRENTPEELERKEIDEVETKKKSLSDEERNERLIKLYKQNFSSKYQDNSIVTKIETHKLTPSVEHKSMVVSLKDVLNDNDDDNKNKKKEKQLDEDSDEDQFEEDEDTEEEDDEKKTTIVPAPSSTQKIPVKIHVELLKPYGMAKLKSKGGGESSNEEEDEDEDDEEEEEIIKDGAKRKQIKNINIEPIVLAPSPNEFLDENNGEIVNKHYSRALFKSHHNKKEEEDDVSNLLEDANLIILLGLVALVTLTLAIVVFLFRGRRNRHRGFIEVDVCTPEESHITGMQVNGYENPTYAFFESKQQI